MNNAVTQSKKKNWLIIIVVAVIIIGGIYMVMPKHLSGTYSHTFPDGETKDSMTFQGNKLIENKGEDYQNVGTYTIKGDQLQMTLKDTTLSATLSSDKNSFTMNSGSGLSMFTGGMTYKKSGN